MSFYRTVVLMITLAIVLGSNAVLVPVVQAGDSSVYILKASEWNVPRTADTVLAMPALHQTIEAYNKQPKAKIQIHYPGGDEGTLWVTELRSWLVALGVASQHIELLPGSRKDGQLELQVVSVPETDQTSR